MLASSAIETGSVEHARVGPAGSAGGGVGGHSVIVKNNMMLAAWSGYVELWASHHSLDSTSMLDIYCAKKCDKLTLTLRLMLLLLLLLVLLLRGLPVGRH